MFCFLIYAHANIQTFRSIADCHPNRFCDINKLHERQYCLDVLFSVAINAKNNNKKATYYQKQNNDKDQIITEFNLKPNRTNHKHISHQNVQQSVQGHQKYMQFQQQHKLGNKKNFYDATSDYAVANETKLFNSMDSRICERFNQKMKEHENDPETQVYLACTFTMHHFPRSARTVIRQTVCVQIYY